MSRVGRLSFPVKKHVVTFKTLKPLFSPSMRPVQFAALMNASMSSPPSVPFTLSKRIVGCASIAI